MNALLDKSQGGQQIITPSLLSTAESASTIGVHFTVRD
jgi:hypothetical protein